MGSDTKLPIRKTTVNMAVVFGWILFGVTKTAFYQGEINI